MVLQNVQVLHKVHVDGDYNDEVEEVLSIRDEEKLGINGKEDKNNRPKQADVSRKVHVKNVREKTNLV